MKSALLLDCEHILQTYPVKEVYTYDEVLSGDAQNRKNAEYLKKTLLESRSNKIVLEWLRVMINNNFYTTEDNRFEFTNTKVQWGYIRSRLQ